MKSLAHPEWPYTGTPHEWQGFAKKIEPLEAPPPIVVPDWTALYIKAIYQKQNFGPELT